MMRRSWRVWLVFLGVFVAGAVAGGFVSLRLVNRVSAQRAPDDLSQRMMQRFNERLELNETQQQVIQPYVERAAAELHYARVQSAETMQQLEQAIARELTPAQRQILETMQAEQRERWKKWMDKHERKLSSPAPTGEPGPGSKPPGDRAPPPP